MDLHNVLGWCQVRNTIPNRLNYSYTKNPEGGGTRRPGTKPKIVVVSIQ